MRVRTIPVDGFVACVFGSDYDLYGFPHRLRVNLLFFCRQGSEHILNSNSFNSQLFVFLFALAAKQNIKAIRKNLTR